MDLTLARFVERLVPLEHSVSRLLSNKTNEEDGNVKSGKIFENSRRGKKRRAEETISPPSPPPLHNEDAQLRGNRVQSSSIDINTFEPRGRRIRLQSDERSTRSGNRRTREPNAIIVIKIKEESELSYQSFMTELRKNIDPEIDLGIRKLSVHKATSGCRIIKITGDESEQQADLLVNKIKENNHKYDDQVSVYRPGLSSRNQMYLEVRGTDDTITEEEVKNQVMKNVGRSVNDISFNKIIYMMRGWRLRFRCTKNTGNKLLDLGYIKIGWSRAGIRLLPKAKIRCYKCLKTGHTVNACKKETDRGQRCYNCRA